ncbi:MAG: carbohydrate binding family 9 domain-containing protein [Acidobacteria bacterium]|nr:carbohydrate binding family 9 domain-containing protein [Acidobacteriota bacterium]
MASSVIISGDGDPTAEGYNHFVETPIKSLPEILLRLSIVLGFLALPKAGWSQSESSSDHKVAFAQYTQSEIAIDGELNEAAWETAQPITEFIQNEPTEGAPASERTVVRVLYDNRNLYIGVYCYERSPEEIVINDIQRDFAPSQQDYFGVLLDTFHDRRSGYYFASTPVGGQRDAQFFDEGRINNVNWDGVWHSQGRIYEDGWTVEFQIPFNTLRFSRENVQVWGLNFLRKIRRNNEQSFWAPLPRRYFLPWRAVALWGELRGIENVEPGRNLQLKPYVIAGFEDFPSRGTPAEGKFDGGLDIKYGLTSNLALDLTANTDFSHVESDTQQVNLSRFPLFFPEKREFFLENSGIFEVGVPRGNQALLFHSRTIGLVGRVPIPILGGARLTGRVGKNHLGFLNMQTRSKDAVPATNFTAMRLRRDIFSNSNVGFIFLNRQSGLTNDRNRAFGVDSNFLFFRTDLRVSSTLAKTYTPGRSGKDWLGKIEGEWQNNLVRFLSSYADIQKNFNPRMGFVRRPGRKVIYHEFDIKPRLRQETRFGSFIRDISTLLTSEHVVLGSGPTENKLFSPRLQITFQDGSNFQARYSQQFERLLGTFEIHEGVEIPRSDYRFDDFLLSYSSNQSKMLSGDISYNWGDFYDGEKTTLGLGLGFRPNYRVSTNIDYERNDVNLPEGSFITDLLGVKLNYSFNPRMFLDAFIQYNSDTSQLDSNIRFRFIHHPLSDFFVVYNEQRDNAEHKTDRSLTIKYTHLLNF